MWGGGHRRAVAALAAACGIGGTLFAGGAGAASCGGFENPCSNETAQQFVYHSVQRQDTPNDPNYDQSEPDTQQPPENRSSNFFDERFDLFGFPSELTTGAIYNVGPSAGKPMPAGFNAAGAWKAERGRPDAVVAILDTGIVWGNTGLRTQIHLNTGELPYPERANGTSCGTYDCNGDGVVNVDDYKEDPRVSLSYAGRTGPAGLITGQDLIHAFGHCQIVSHEIGPEGCPANGSFDNDGNGYANDIAGWNFFDNNNEPADLSSYFAAHHHGTGRASDVAERGNDKEGSIGVCPHCQVMPIRIWDTFVSDGNTFALGITYATDNGAKVIEGANGSTYHSAFSEAASQYAYEHGVVQTFSGDDLNTGNHNYPANYSHAMLIQGTVPDTDGLGKANKEWLEAEKFCGVAGQPVCFGSNAPVKTFFRGANTTQYGGKSSISMEGATGSVNTSKAAGAAGLLVSAGLDHGVVLRPDETRELLEQTAERVLTGNTEGSGVADPAANPTLPPDEQWTPHFGWGRANVGAAVGAVIAGDIPPEAAIYSPDWYAPLTGASVDITGLARARFAAGGKFHWKLMWGTGEAPSSWTTVHEGESSEIVSDFGSIDLTEVRKALETFVVPPDSGGPTFAASEPNPYQHEFTVQLEVTGKGISMTGIDRRVLDTFTDPTLVSGFPKRMGTGGESPTRYADLTGNNVQELIVPTEDGFVHAYKPDGSELAGWPVHTQTEQAALGHSGSPALTALGLPNEPPRGPLIADLAENGSSDVIVVAGIHLYAWQGNGQPVPGFPVSSNPAFCGPALENDNSHPKCGFLAAPALAHLEGFGKGVDIVEPSLDGHVYAWRANGEAVPGYPIALVDPEQVAKHEQMIAESINEPAIGDLTGSGHDDIVVASNEEYGAPSNLGEVSFAEVTAKAAGSKSRLYAIDGASGKFLPGWPVKLPGIIQNVLPLVGPGQDAEIAKIGGETVIVASTTGGALEELNPAGAVVRTMQQTGGSAAYGSASDATDKSGAINLFESASVGDLLGTGLPDVVKYELSLEDAANLLLVSQNFPYNHLIGAWDGTTAKPLEAYPTVTDDFQFLSASNIAKIEPTLPTNQIVTGTGLGLLHAYDGATGQDVSGFPKVTGGWLAAPASLSWDGRIADMTREGYLFEWQTKAPACQSQWPTFRHDQQDSGNYNHDGTPPDAPEAVTLTALGSGKSRLAFIAPGDNGPCGTPTSYRTLVNGAQVNLGLQPVAGGSSFSAEIALPSNTRSFSIQAIDAAGNIGPPAVVQLSPPTVTTEPASSVTGSSAILHANVNPNGVEVSACSFEYGPTTAYGQSAPCTPSPGFGSSPVAVSASIGGLSSNKTYHFRISATSSAGTSTGSDQSFTTPQLPTVVTEAASAVAKNSATLRASVNPNGVEVSECKFEYGTTTSYGSSATCSPAPGSGTTPVAVSASIGGLTPSTTYHFRISATNAGAMSTGSDQMFTTAATGTGTPHYYSDGALVKSTSRVSIAWGNVTLKSVRGGVAGSFVTCHSVGAGAMLNPEGGGAGEGSTQVFATFGCESEGICPAGQPSAVIGENLPWHNVLTEEVLATIRQETTGVRLVIECLLGEKVESVSKYAQGAGEKGPRPRAVEGTSALHPSLLEFDEGSGVLEEQGSGGTVTRKAEGAVKLLGYNAQELISVKSP